ncbi:MAG: hypothetical protein ACYCYA_14965 [Actinomycetes bacterium]
MGVGAVVGVVGYRAAQRRVRRWAPAGLAERACGALGAGMGGARERAGAFVTQVRHATRERERQIREEIGQATGSGGRATGRTARPGPGPGPGPGEDTY